MGAAIEPIYISTYENTVRHLAQQGAARLLPWVMQKSVQSEAHNWDRMAAAVATEKTTRKQTTPDNNTAFTRRQSQPKVWNVGDVTEQEDITQVLINPNSEYAKAHAKAIRRAQDDAIIEAAVGASRDGDGAAVAFDTNQNLGTGAEVLSFDLVTETTELFMSNDIDPDEEKVMVIGPKQARKLLQLTEATSGDYNALRPLTAKGYVESWMGYSWLVSNRLQAPAGGQIYCFAMTKQALGMQMNRDFTAKVAEDPSISFAWRIYGFSQFGAIRVEDEHLVRLHLSDTV